MSLSTLLSRWVDHRWYGPTAPPWLKPIEILFRESVLLRREAYATGRIKSAPLPVPVIVIGNLTVGGTGKTPLTLWLAQYLRKQGYRPGIISRGYGGSSRRRPLAVGFHTPACVAGDEPVLIARRTGCPVYVFPRRVEAGQALLAKHDCNVIIADDGLQHYPLQRDIEIVVVDGRRGFGNGHLLPAGPLREPVERLESADLVVYNGGTPPPGAHAMRLEGSLAVNLLNACKRRPLESFKGEPLWALAGIGHPQRFFDALANRGLCFKSRSFPDHHAYRPEELAFRGDDPLLMTEKDAVKCREFARDNDWYLPVEARLPDPFGKQLLQLLRARHHG